MSSNVKEEVQQARTHSTATSRGTLFVVSSPSGGGKGTIIRHVLDVVPNLSYSVSYTTRAPRLNEVDGREYFFVSRETFEEMVAAGEFLEWACVHGNFYGTSKSQILEETAAGADRATLGENPTTHAAGLRVPGPLGDRLILRALRESGGDAASDPLRDPVCPIHPASAWLWSSHTRGPEQCAVGSLRRRFAPRRGASSQASAS